MQMQARFGFSPWVPALPIEKLFLYAHAGELFTITDDMIVGTFALAPHSFGIDYPQSLLIDSSASALYISKLAIRPDQQGRGIGSSVLEFAAAQAIERGIGFIRLDALTAHTALERFYCEAGFSVRGSFPTCINGVASEVSLYEKALTTSILSS